MKLSEFLKEERTKRCLTQQEMADCIGVNQPTYATYEKAWVNKKTGRKAIPGKITARRIAAFTGKSSEYIKELIENERN